TYFYHPQSANHVYAAGFPTYASYISAYPAHEVGTVNADPQYANAAQGDFTPTNPALFFTGTNLQTEVPYDYYGNPRPANPTPGAIERGPDAAITQLISPTGTFCSSNKS